MFLIFSPLSQAAFKYINCIDRKMCIFYSEGLSKCLDWFSFAIPLGVNISLRALDVSWNNIRAKGATRLAEGIKVSTQFLFCVVLENVK